jgi:hypothetical protein
LFFSFVSQFVGRLRAGMQDASPSGGRSDGVPEDFSIDAESGEVEDHDTKRSGERSVLSWFHAQSAGEEEANHFRLVGAHSFGRDFADCGSCFDHQIGAVQCRRCAGRDWRALFHTWSVHFVYSHQCL